MKTKNKKFLIVLMIISFLLLVGCQSNNNPIYTINSECLYHSSEYAYDYSFALNNYWSLDVKIHDDMIFTNDKNDVKIYIAKNIDNSKELKNKNLQAKELPSLIYSEFNNLNLNIEKMISSKHTVDYQNEMKFFHEYGTINDINIQIISFMSNYSIPSVSGGKAINAIAITYSNENNQKDIEKFIEDIEQNIQYE